MPEVLERLEDVDYILQTARQNVRHLREKLETSEEEMTKIDIRNALITAEQDLELKMEEVATKLDNTIRTMPLTSQTVCIMPVLVTGPLTDSYKIIDHASLLSYMLKQPLNFGWKSRGGKVHMTAKQQINEEREIRSALSPYSSLNRAVVKNKYGVDLPHLLQRKSAAPSSGRVVVGQTAQPLSVPPKANRLNPLLTLPPIPRRDLHKGILSLIERRWIPRSARLTLRPPPITKSQMPLHLFTDKFASTSTHAMSVTVKTPSCEVVEEGDPEDEGDKQHLPVTPSLSTSQCDRGASLLAIHRLSCISSKSSMLLVKNLSAMASLGSLLPPQASASTETLKAQSKETEEDAETQFTVENGVVCRTDAAFTKFKNTYSSLWENIEPVIEHLEMVMTRFAIPTAIISGDILALLSLNCEEESRLPTLEELMIISKNRDVVEELITQPGRQFKGPEGRDLAALLIQTTWRCHRDHATYRTYRKLMKAVRVLERFFNHHLCKKRIRQHMQRTYAGLLERFHQRAKVLADTWEKVKNSKHVVIHVPSLGYGKVVREMVSDMAAQQNNQMARLCEIHDPNVDVIYVSPVALTEEAQQYYSRLLGLSGAVRTGHAQDQEDLSSRFKIIVPDILTTLTSKQMCLSSKLACCHKTLKRLSALIAGRPAYMVPGVFHPDDLAVADALQVPLLGAPPEVAARYAHKAGAHALFGKADIPVPPGTCGIRHEQQLYETLTWLVLDNLETRRWLLKLNQEFDGRGTAYCDITAHLSCFTWLKKEAKRCGQQWKTSIIHESAFGMVLREIPAILRDHTVLPSAYRKWVFFFTEFLIQGGLVEAYPHSHDVATVTVNLLVEPSGQIHTLMTGDQIHAQCRLYKLGWSLPQTSMEPMSVNKLCRRAAIACRDAGVVGYIRIDLVTFVEPNTVQDVVWAIGLHLGYSESLALFQLAVYLSHGHFHARTHCFTIAARQNDKSEEVGRIPRFCVMSCKLMHSNIALLHLSVFLRLCRAHGIGYDIKGREGTVFTLIDVIHREQLGMITLGTTLVSALATFARHLRTIHEEISTPKMHGYTNFMATITEIESVVHSVQQNMAMVRSLEAEKKKEEEEGKEKP